MYYSFRHIITIATMISASTLSIQAQHNVAISVHDEHHQPMETAIVMFVSLPDSILVSTSLTDIQGRLGVALKTGKYLLSVKTLGYEDYRRHIEVKTDTILPTISLKPDGITLKDVVITARKVRPMVSSSNGRIDINVANSYLADVGNALDVLRHSPGISVNNKGGISLSSLGNTAVYVNGRKLMLEGEQLAAYLHTLTSAQIARIETSPSPDASFEADGAGGMVNIILKRNSQTGFYLTTSQRISYWHHLKEEADLSMAYNTARWQLGLHYNHSIGHYDMKYGYDKIQNGNRSISETNDTDKRNTYAADVDFTWVPNEHNKLSLNSSINALVGPGETQTQTEVYKGMTTPDGILKAANHYLKQRNTRYSNSLNYEYTPSPHSTLSLTADWTHVNDLAECEQPNTYYSAMGQSVRHEQYYSEPKKDINILAALADYSYHPEKQWELSAGVKTSWIRCNNTFLFQNNMMIDKERSNIFNYNERNIEGYLQYTHSWRKWRMSGGLRLEYMHTHNRLQDFKRPESVANTRELFQLFPNLTVSYTINNNSKLSLLYSKRQDKPRYEDLNPFEYLLDELSYWKGNPYLKPQLSNKIMLNYVWKSLTVSLFYDHLENYFAAMTDVFGKDKTIMTTKNIGNQQQLGIEAYFSKRLTSWWDVGTNAGIYYFVNIMTDENYHQRYERPSFTWAANSNVTLPYQINCELSARYFSKRQGSSYEVNKATGAVDIALNKNWHDGRIRLSLLMTDVLHTERWDNFGNKGALTLSAWGYGESRRIVLTFAYRFGKERWKKTEQNLEEINRL